MASSFVTLFASSCDLDIGTTDATSGSFLMVLLLFLSSRMADFRFDFGGGTSFLEGPTGTSDLEELDDSRGDLVLGVSALGGEGARDFRRGFFRIGGFISATGAGVAEEDFDLLSRLTWSWGSSLKIDRGGAGESSASELRDWTAVFGDMAIAESLWPFQLLVRPVCSLWEHNKFRPSLRQAWTFKQTNKQTDRKKERQTEKQPINSKQTNKQKCVPSKRTSAFC